MRWTNVKLIFAREVRDQLRDRRTLFMVAILPLLLYPALGIGMAQMMMLFREQPRTVVILGADDLPADPPLLVGDRLAARWFDDSPDEASKLLVITDRSRDEAAVHEPPHRPGEAEALLATAREIRAQLDERDRLAQQLAAVEPSARRDQLQARLDALDARLSDVFARSRIEVLIVVPPGFGRALAAIDRQLSGGRAADGAPVEFRPLRPVRNRANEKSLIAYNRLKAALDAWWDELREERFTQAGLPRQFAAPISADPIDLAKDEQLSAGLWSKLLPALLVMMALTGAFYPSIDMAAGEKERGTMETLLICPARRSEIVLGKFLTVLGFSSSTALLNLASMGLTGKYMASVTGGSALERLGSLQPPPLASLVWVVVLLLPLSALFGSLCLALATFARSSKEGQYYLTPLLMVTMGITIFCISPGVEIDPFKSIMPVMGPALLVREVLSAPGDARPLVYAIPVLVTSVGYSLLALWWAIEQFSREEVLFREAERFELRLWLRHLLRDKEPTPSFTEAGFCFVLIMLLQFAALSFLRQFQGPDRLVRVLMIQQIATVAAPALLMGVLLTTDFARTFRLRLPPWRILAVAAVLPLALHPLTNELLHLLLRLEWLPPIPDWLHEALGRLRERDIPLWQVLLAIAVVPAVCEELAFRGLILSGFSRSGRTWLPIVLSAVLFGIVHLIPQQVFNASLLGLVLGLLVLRSGSLLPAIVFHVIYNGLNVVRWRLDPAVLTRGPLEWFASVEGGEVHYRWPTLVICGVVAAVLLRWLVRAPNRQERLTGTAAGPDSRSPAAAADPAFADEPAIGVGSSP
ncbi:MAG TPA: ABC transporter permease subunit/CPBP intramembrane protease [Planctomycetaceae bacterium]|nr:ABC transporter permease subunit/CPBP intramembrane protease [Planctomycetaceae bacterium]